MKRSLVPCLLLFGCASPEAPECTRAQCAQVCAHHLAGNPANTVIVAETPKWSAFEAELLSPLLSEMKDGVRLFDAGNGLGVCSGDRRCDTLIGRDVETLPPGEYMVRAELTVPRTGPRGTWEVRYDSACDVLGPDGAVIDQRSYERTYSVQWGGTDRAFRIDPLERVRSPDPAGELRCTYSLTPLHPEAETIWSGSYGVPAGT